MAPAYPCPYPGCPERQPCPVHARTLAREKQQRSVRRPGHRWYHWQRWRHPVWGLRAQVLADDPWCVECRKAGVLEVAVDIDHVLPHEGDPERFWDRGNLAGLCRGHHTAKTRRGA